jgi:hypothetical protein
MLLQLFPSLFALVAGLLLIGCGPAPEPEAGADTGTVSLQFSVSDGVRESTNLDSELSGNIYGALFYASEVNVFGPLEGADQYAEIDVFDVDLTSDTVSSQVWTSEPLTGNTYAFMGFFDIDDNDADDKDPDSGDPVSFPGTTDFDVFEGEDLEYVIEFVMVR